MYAQKVDHKNKINPVAAALTGAVVGAGVAVAGAAVLKDEKNKAALKKVLNTAKDRALEMAQKAQKDINKPEVKKQITKAAKVQVKKAL